MDDDSWIARSVLGATLSVSLGLFTVALCHYLGVARLMLALSSTEPSLGQLYVDESRVGLDATGVHITWIRDPATAMMIVLGAVAYGLAGFRTFSWALILDEWTNGGVPRWRCVRYLHALSTASSLVGSG